MDNKPAPHWLLLRGLARESAHWGDFVPLLQAAFPEVRITLLDLPGTGHHYQDPSPSQLQDITATVRDHAHANGYLQHPVTILAISLGAMVAWDWQQRYPTEISNAILINPSFASLSPFYLRLRWQCYPKFLALICQRDLLKRERAILQLVSRCRDHDDANSQAWAHIQQLRPVSLGNMLRQIIAAARYRPQDLPPQIPILLLSGLGDQLVSPRCADAIQQQWQLPIRRHPWAGHDLTLDDGAWVITQLKDWVASTTA